jgi:putative ABC transport system permease protein
MRGELGPAPPSAWVTGVAAGLALFGLLAWQMRETEASLKILLGAMGLVGVLWALGAVSIALLRRGPWRGTWRWAVKRLCEPGNHAVLQVCGLAVGITALLVLGVLRVELVERWRTSLPERSPNHFLIGIQTDERPGLDALFRRHGLEAPVYHPIVRGRLVAINERAVEPEHYEGLRARRLAAREFNLTWAERLAADNRVVAGRWWGETPGAGFSVEEGIARTLGIHLGDRLRFRIAGAELSAPVTSLRDVDWESFHANFFVIASPGLLSGAPVSLMTAFYLAPGRRGFIAELARGFPGVTDIDVDMILQQVRGIMDRAALAIEYVFGFTLLAGALVMFAAIRSGLAGRRREIALRRALGASRGRILKGLAAEFALLGALAGALAALMASIAGYGITTQVFELSAAPSPWLWLWGVAGAVTGVVTVGLLGTRRLLDQPPWPILQQANG